MGQASSSKGQRLRHLVTHWFESVTNAHLHRSAAPLHTYRFAAAGRIARAGGRVLPRHIHFVERLIRLRLAETDVTRGQAIKWFRAGKEERVDFHQLALAAGRNASDAGIAVLLDDLCRLCVIDFTPASNRTLTLLTRLVGISNDALVAALSRAHAAQRAVAAAEAELGVASSADLAAIKSAYRALCRDHHPDRLPPDADEAQIRRAHERMTAITGAFEALKADRAVE